MSYLVLARKYRPQRFGEMTGQEHVVRTLSNALQHRPARARVPVHRAARRRQDHHRPPGRQGAQLREGSDRRALRRLPALPRDRRGARGRRDRDRRRLEQRRRQRPRHRRGGEVPARPRPLQGLRHRRGPHAVAGRLQRAPEDAGGAAAAREVRAGHHRRPQGPRDHPLPLPAVRLPPAHAPPDRRPARQGRGRGGDAALPGRAGAGGPRRPRAGCATRSRCSTRCGRPAATRRTTRRWPRRSGRWTPRPCRASPRRWSAATAAAVLAEIEALHAAASR